MSGRNLEMQERSKAGKERKRSTRKGGRRQDEAPDFILGDGKGHYSRQPLGHLASELADQNKMDEAANLVVGLRPWAQRSTIGAEVVIDRFDHKEKASGNAKLRLRTGSSDEIREAMSNRSMVK